jgi:glycosyltransferase involved in cell wall biosynthesis
MNNSFRILAWPAFKAKLSPYNALLYKGMQELGATVDEFTAGRALFGRYDVVHLHWPEYCVNERGPWASVFWASALFGAMFWIRLRGGIVIWTVHNLESHLRQHPFMERCFWKMFTSLLNGYICLTEDGAARARQRYPSLRRIPGFVIPHGNIRDAYPGTDITREQARFRLGIPASAKVLAFFGSIQPYKGVTELIETFAAIRDRDAFLVVAGRCSLPPIERARLESIASADGRVLLHFEYIPNAEVACYIRAADLLVLPFREILNSGSAILSLALDRPVLVPAKGSMRELEQFAGADWVRIFQGDLSPALLQQELDRATDNITRTNARCPVLQNGWDGLGWTDLAQMTLSAYHSVKRSEPQRSSNISASPSPTAAQHNHKSL